MKGSEKQVAWANDIVKKWSNQIKNVVDSAHSRVANKSMPERWAEIADEKSSFLLNRINKPGNEAAAIIRMKGIDMGDELSKEMIKEYES